MSVSHNLQGQGAVVSSVNGMVISIPAQNKHVIPLLTKGENAKVISSSRTSQLMTGEVSPEDMTEVVTREVKIDNRKLSHVVASIDVNALSADEIGDQASELKEAKTVIKKKKPSDVASRAKAAGSAEDDLIDLN